MAEDGFQEVWGDLPVHSHHHLEMQMASSAHCWCDHQCAGDRGVLRKGDEQELRPAGLGLLWDVQEAE